MKLKRCGIVLKPKGEIGAIFNCGATEYNGNIYLLLRVVKKGYIKKKDGPGYENYISEIWLAKSRDGKKFTLSDRPLIKPEYEWELFGCEDPRITKLGNEYFILYTAKTKPAFSGGDRIGFASTKDFSKVEKYGIIGPDADDKDAVIFPDKINRQIGVLHRIDKAIQIMYFKNIAQLKKNHGDKSWREYMNELDKYIVLDRKYKWESKKIGSGPPPIKTREGWLLIYHGVDKNSVYRMGAALLDLDNPLKVIARSPTPILKPEKNYEKIGDMSNVVFPVGAVIRRDELFIYYGAADKRCCLVIYKLNDLLDYLLKHK